ncbi:hypothetical protein N0V87_002585 [Didymella glomerata]|uniref:Uncharacterized protein n=1 Tax=Didymella glomerata TaxID=749621 RepID=A0A9W8X3R5_9PLEO|nr:hypothetical protein N0V87_002585 [Didymella glomerata]
MRSRGTHTRNVSDWSQFSGFTYYITPVNSGPTSPRRSRVVSMNEMEMRTRTIGVGKAADETSIGVAVTTLHNKSVRGSEAGEEMAELAKLFADKGKDWGTESSYIGYASMFSYLSTSSSLLQSPPSNINNTFIIPDYCGLSPSYSQNLTYLRAYEVNKDGHEFVYHHELFGLDQYEVDDSGRRNVPVSEAKEVDDVEGHCDGICSELDSMRRMKSQCKGKACKAQVRRG